MPNGEFLSKTAQQRQQQSQQQTRQDSKHKDTRQTARTPATILQDEGLGVGLNSKVKQII